MKTYRNGKRRFRSLIVILLMILAFCSGFFGHTLLNARAESRTPRGLTVTIPVSSCVRETVSGSLQNSTVRGALTPARNM